MNSRPLIFVSNDDGIDALGLKSLVKYLKDFGDVVVAAPVAPQSGKSSSITVEVPLRAYPVENFEGAIAAYKVTGTPVDCTKLAMHTLLPHKPDFVVAGINHGANTGISALYSGTMGVAFEGCISGVPSVAFSYLSHEAHADFSTCEPVIKSVMEDVIANGIPDNVCFNVNIPANCEVKGVKAAIAAPGRWTDEFATRIDPHGHTIYWLTGTYKEYEPNNPATDLSVIAQGYASLVPCTPEQTVFSLVSELSERFNK